ncbi:MAG TPA: redoxin domain-containing protein [Bacteroidia bacterium]|nr:redoxin domain-containing protein [Bacteroidia bacterium]
MKSRLFLLSFLLLLVSCGKAPVFSGEILNETFVSPEGLKVQLNDLKGSVGTVVVFFSPECPLCINYTKTIKDLDSLFARSGISFILVYPGKYYSATQISAFSRTYALHEHDVLDPELKIAEKFKATVTPEAILFDREGNIVYSGAIDDWSYETGRKKRTAANKYLFEGITALLESRKPAIAYVEPAGCYIE